MKYVYPMSKIKMQPKLRTICIKLIILYKHKIQIKAGLIPSLQSNSNCKLTAIYF